MEMGPLEPGKWLLNFLKDQTAFIQHSSNSQQMFTGGGFSVPGTVKALGDLMVNQLDGVPFLRDLWS